ncbi:MAG: competence/damage-inducible protein A [Cyclobacteriaceae bacterium]|nr:competence/damage-inducible protein A [Cyclobacteriaceae bacterium]MCK5367651.1 competence/damage-inducible protein A [Cyclobacteriaceae bacterium]
MKEVLAELITIGDEILYGQTLDTNAHWMSGELDEIGVRVIRRTTCGDAEEEILQALREAEQRADIILITGGLGPTSDDLTKPCLAKYFDCDIIMNKQALAELESYMTSRGRGLNKLTRLQAALPEKCEMVSNERGTACGMWFNKSGKVFISMPGVPHEMKFMMREKIIPRLMQEFELPIIYHKIVRLAGIGESWLAERIEDWENALPQNVKLAYLPTFGDLKLRLTANGTDPDAIRLEVDQLIQDLLPLIQEYVYGYDDDSLEFVIGMLLKKNNQKLALAESCTGGYVAHRITSISGSSEYFNGAIVPYQNEMKIEQLGVKPETIEKYGAVSEETVTEMALNVRQKFNADYGLASSGIAGPGGGTPEKPVGLIWIACAWGNEIKTRKLNLTKDRDVNIRITSVALLTLLHERLVKNN